MASKDTKQQVLRRRLSLLWSWDEDEEMVQTQYSTPRGPDPTTASLGTIELIDLVSPSVSPQGLKQAPYKPKTLSAQNQQRLSILPLFPPHERLVSTGSVLLLANVSSKHLSIEQVTCRRPGQYVPTFTLSMTSTTEDSFMKEKFDYFFNDLLQRMKIDMRILDYNYTRMKYFLQLFAQSRNRILNGNRSIMSQWLIKEEEYPILLEFYLQMDVDLFYMKTCSFRQAQPRSEQEGLFCLEIPECRYTMMACGQCDLCRDQAFVQFNRYERHRFVNGYESILNAPATCSTMNIIYVLTCPCGKYDYIGETSQVLGQCLRRHRQFGHQFIHEFLIGEKNRQRAHGIQQNSELASKSRMRLYQHSIRCSTAIQLFLKYNPQYWCFVPMLKEDIHRYSQFIVAHPIPDGNRPMERRLNYVPTPPEGYQFSRRQLSKQYEYFVKQSDRQLPYPDLNLYHAKIIAVLPMETSELFRQVIHTLFVTHTESKLNTMGHLFDSNMHTDLHTGVWCEDITRPQTSTATTTTTTAMHY